MQKKYLNLRGISEILSEKEMRNVVGASSGTGSYSDKIACYVLEKRGNTNVQIDSYWCDDSYTKCQADCESKHTLPEWCACGYVPMG